MSEYPGCRSYQGTRSDLTGLWLACEVCGYPQAAHSPEARLVPDDQMPPPEPLGLEATILVVLKRHRIDWTPGSWRCSCGEGGWTTARHWNEHHASLIAEAVEQLGLIRTGANTWSAPLSDPDANRAGIAGARPTSAAAALRVQPRSGTQRRAILDYIAQHGPSTDEQIQRALDLSGNTERPRRSELVEGGWVQEHDRLRLGSGQLVAIRWGLTSRARAQLGPSHFAGAVGS